MAKYQDLQNDERSRETGQTHLQYSSTCSRRSTRRKSKLSMPTHFAAAAPGASEWSRFPQHLPGANAAQLIRPGDQAPAAIGAIRQTFLFNGALGTIIADV